MLADGGRRLVAVVIGLRFWCDGFSSCSPTYGYTQSMTWMGYEATRGVPRNIRRACRGGIDSKLSFLALRCTLGGVFLLSKETDARGRPEI